MNVKVLKSFVSAHDAVNWLTQNRIEDTSIETTGTLKSMGMGPVPSGNYHVVLKDSDMRNTTRYVTGTEVDPDIQTSEAGNFAGYLSDLAKDEEPSARDVNVNRETARDVLNVDPDKGGDARTGRMAKVISGRAQQILDAHDEGDLQLGRDAHSTYSKLADENSVAEKLTRSITKSIMDVLKASEDSDSGSNDIGDPTPMKEVEIQGNTLQDEDTTALIDRYAKSDDPYHAAAGSRAQSGDRQALRDLREHHDLGGHIPGKDFYNPVDSNENENSALTNENTSPTSTTQPTSNRDTNQQVKDFFTGMGDSAAARGRDRTANQLSQGPVKFNSDAARAQAAQNPYYNIDENGSVIGVLGNDGNWVGSKPDKTNPDGTRFL